MAALLTAAAGRSHQSPSADSDLGERQPRLGFWHPWDVLSTACGLPTTESCSHLTPCSFVESPKVSPVVFGTNWEAEVEVTRQENQDTAVSPVQGLPVLVPVLLPGRVRPIHIYN